MATDGGELVLVDPGTFKQFLTSCSMSLSSLGYQIRDLANPSLLFLGAVNAARTIFTTATCWYDNASSPKKTIGLHTHFLPLFEVRL